MKCRNCRHLYKDWCAHKLDSPDPDLDRECKDYMQATHADRIRSMSNESYRSSSVNSDPVVQTGTHAADARQRATAEPDTTGWRTGSRCQRRRTIRNE